MSVGDTNQDGVVDEEEYFLEFKREIPGWRWNATETKVVYDLCDLNGDGLVSPDELRNGLEAMRHVFKIPIMNCFRKHPYIHTKKHKCKKNNKYIVFSLNVISTRKRKK